MLLSTPFCYLEIQKNINLYKQAFLGYEIYYDQVSFISAYGGKKT